MIIDIIVLAVLIVSALIAFLRGFIREVLTIVGMLGASAAAYALGPKLLPMVKGWLGVVDGEKSQKLFDVLPYPIVADIIAFGGVFVVVLIALSIMSHFISEGARKIGLGPVDRTFGVIFGLVRGVLLLGLMFLPVHLLVGQETKDDWFKGSQSYFYLEKVASAIADYMPNSAKEKIQQTADKAEQTNETRQKLQELNLLNKKTGEQDAPANKDEENLPHGQVTDPHDKNGYTEDFRNQMDSLFQQTEPKTDKDKP